MSYYLMEGNIKNQRNEISNFSQFMNKYTSKRNYNSNGLNSFLSLQISSNHIIPKNQFNNINSQYNIFKNSFKEKIKKKMNNLNSNKNFKSNRTKNKNNYINLEFFEESKQNNFIGKTNNEFNLETNKLLFENQTKKSIRENNFFKSKNIKENNTLYSLSRINQVKSNNINNYLFKTYWTNINNNKKVLSFNYDDHKTSDYFKEKNDIFGYKFNYNTNKRKNFELEYNRNIFKTTKNIIYPKRRNCQSLTSIFQSRLNNRNKSTYTYLYNTNNYNYNNRNNRSSLIRRQTNIFSSSIYF